MDVQAESRAMNARFEDLPMINLLLLMRAASISEFAGQQAFLFGALRIERLTGGVDPQ
jgi:hypothetical protein